MSIYLDLMRTFEIAGKRLALTGSNHPGFGPILP
jgi:hypothetical protein